MEWRFINSIFELPPEQWNSLCTSGYPFIRHEFLAALEKTGCTTPETGWQPHHLIAVQNDELIAALPTYIKNHSYGEYVFDWSWANAYHRYGQAYYPKLVSAIPFTPCYSTRFLNRNPAQALPFEIIKAEVERLQLSSWHCLFPNEQESAVWREAGALQRLGCQFHWFNRDYKNFDDFLAQMNSRKRKNISKERREIAQQGIRFEWREGSAIQPEEWSAFYQLYRNTYLKRSGRQGYLTEAFFQQLGVSIPDNLLLIHAHLPAVQGKPKHLASALFLRDEDTLYGRYWGCYEEHEYLHFETCFYQGIDYAITHGLQRFDGGAQGEHKIQRGFAPVFTYSNHWLRDSRFHHAISQALQAEAKEVRQYQIEASAYLPFKNTIA